MTVMRLPLLVLVSGYLVAAGGTCGAELHSGNQSSSGATVGVAQLGECAGRGEKPDAPGAVESGDAALAQADCYMKTGRNGLAALLLQRVLSEQPVNARAADMLRRAEHSMGLVRPEKGEEVASPGVFAEDKLRLSGWVAIEAGHDSNLNSATARTSIEVPLLNYRSLALAPVLVQKQSSFAGVHGGLMANYSLTPGWELGLHGAVSARYNDAEVSYFPYNHLISGHLARHLGPVTVSVKMSNAQYNIARYSILEKQSASLGAEIQLTGSLSFNAAADSSKIQYPLYGKLRTDSDGWSVGVRDSRIGISLQASGGAEKSGAAIRDLDRSFSSINLAWSHRYEHFGRVTIGANNARSDYTEFSQLFNTYRRDRVRGLHASLEYPLAKDWHLTPRWLRDRNDSNLQLAAFKRNQWMVELRRDF